MHGAFGRGLWSTFAFKTICHPEKSSESKVKNIIAATTSPTIDFHEAKNRSVEWRKQWCEKVNPKRNRKRYVWIWNDVTYAMAHEYHFRYVFKFIEKKLNAP